MYIAAIELRTLNNQSALDNYFLELKSIHVVTNLETNVGKSIT